jgi:Starch-binding associating with outer membrane/Susd and RagB outer membrane lipoprotein
MKLKFCLYIMLFTIALSSCKKLDDSFGNLLNNPNSPTPGSADVDLYLNAAQLNFTGFVDNANTFSNALVRMEFFSGPTYTNAGFYTPQSFDGIWTTAYTGVLKNADALIPVATAQKKTTHIGIAKVLKAYTFMTMVDCFGNIPYTEANKGSANTNPSLTQGSVVYADCIALLNSAIADFSVTPEPPAPTNDLYYKGVRANWKSLSKMLLFRAYMQTRLVDNAVQGKIDALLADADLASFKDFEFRFGSKALAPDSRHPKYAGNYTDGGASDYLGNYFMWSLALEKGFPDPRLRYYVYRQANLAKILALPPVTLAFTLPCNTQAAPAHYPAGTPFCITGDGYLGRDHGDGSGIPPDNQFRATWGVYPAGGKFDANDNVAVKLVDGGQGQGIQPLFLSSFYDFLHAEYQLTVKNNTSQAKTLLVNGIQKSFTKVFGFPATVGVTPTASFVPAAVDQNNYINYVTNQYDAQTSNDGRLNVIMKEYYLALWGNGLDAYNNYRRTGKPGNMQPVLESNPGPFIRSFLYPSSSVAANSNVKQKPNNAVQVFWDNNPANFIK